LALRRRTAKLTCPAGIPITDTNAQGAVQNKLDGRVRCSAGFGLPTDGTRTQRHDRRRFRGADHRRRPPLTHHRPVTGNVGTRRILLVQVFDFPGGGGATIV
jgi:hypothetical protein